MAASVQPKSSINCILIIVKLFGAFPWSDKKHKHIYFNTELIYAVVFLFTYYLLFICTFQQKEDVTEINYIVNVVLCILLTSIFTTIQVTCFKNKHILNEIINRFATFDQNLLTKLKIKVNYFRSFLLTLVLTVILTALLLVSFWADYFILVEEFQLESTFKWLIIFIPIIINSYYQTFISILAFLLYQRFSKINSSLNNISKPKWRTTALVYPVKLNGTINNFTIEMIRDIKSLNEDLRCLANDIKSCFSIPIFLSVATAFFAITVQIYYLIVLLSNKMNNNADGITKISFCLINFTLIHAMQLLMVVAGFHFAKDEIDNTSSILNSINHDNNKELVEEITSFSINMYNHPVNFTIMSVFTLDFGLMSTMAGAIITYVLILLQLRSQDARNEKGNGIEALRKKGREIALLNRQD